MYTLISFATQWGSKFGGINSFNTDFLNAFGVAYYHGAQIFCIVASATEEERSDALKSYVRLVPLPYSPNEKEFGEAQARVGIDELKRLNVDFEPEKTIWLGHDRITGAAAVAAAKTVGGRSAIIHHMSYDHYESFAENSQTAYAKAQAQTSLFSQVDLLLAVGPLLRDAASDRLGAEKSVYMLVPGLAEIKVREAPKTFTAFISGRLSEDAARIKQGHLGIAAFAKAHCEARDNGMPEGLCRQPKLVLRGVDFETATPAAAETDLETDLKKFAEDYSHGVINLHALPFTQNRETLYADLSAATVALMPSWHEGFGLVAWEAIAAGVPLIVSKNSGAYQLLEENFPGAGPGCVYPIDVRGAVASPFFHAEDLKAVTNALKDIAKNPSDARRKAGSLRSMLSEKYSWTTCVGQAMEAFDWNLQPGCIPTPAAALEPNATTPPSVKPPQTGSPSLTSPLQLPQKSWKLGVGFADSMLLRAEEAIVGFDPARQPEIDSLNSWLDNPEYPQAVRLIAGPGGSGKTRLALELCQQRVATGWQAGFLDADIAAKDMTATWQTLKSNCQPLLIVIDYAETRQESLLALIKAILQAPNTQRVRLLLLARAGGEWWDNLPSKNSYCEPLLSGYATSLFNLPALHPDEQHRQHAYQQAMLNFSQALDVAPPRVDMAPSLTEEHFEHPLYIQMAALLALHGERPTSPEGLTKALLNHERRYWHRLFAPYGWIKPENLAQQLLALATLAGGFATPKEAGNYWKAAGLSVLNNMDFNTLFNTLVPLYLGKQGLQAVRPDLLGEALAAETLLLPECGDILNAVLGRTVGQTIRRHALTVLARLSNNRTEVYESIFDALTHFYADCCQDLIAVAIETPGHLPPLAEMTFSLLQPAVKSQVAGLLKSIVAEKSVQLSGLSCVVSEYLAQKARSKWEKNNKNLNLMSELAGALNNYSLSLSFAGHNSLALNSSLEAVTLFKRLFNQDKKNYEANYAAALGNYASRLRDAGKNDEALSYAQQALEIHQRLAQKNSDRYDRNHAMLLGNYASHLRDAGKNDEALAYAQQALEIDQRLAQKKPDRYDPDHATSLNNYASHLSDAGKNDEALAYARQSLEINQRLAQKKPDRYDPDHATSLTNYARHLSDAGKNDEALSYARQGLKIHQRLAQKNPDRYEANLFNSVCSVHFLTWLTANSGTDADLTDLLKLPTKAQAHRRSLLDLYAAFLQGCWSSDQTTRVESFGRVLSIYETLSTANKIDALPPWLCVAAWGDTFSPDLVIGLNWRASLDSYVLQRKGNIPDWLNKVAARLDFQWPPHFLQRG